MITTFPTLPAADDDKFVRIVTDHQIAVDRNHNGIVDEDEIYNYDSK